MQNSPTVVSGDLCPETLPASVLVKKQTKKFRVETDDSVIIAEVGHDDDCGNGHNSFSITAEIYEPGYRRGEPSVAHKSGCTFWLSCCGCCHEEIAKHFPKLAPLIRWHLTSTDGPMHYIANALYWAGHCDPRWCDGKPGSPPREDCLKSTIVYGALGDRDLAFPIGSYVFDPTAPPAANQHKRERLEEWLRNRRQALLEEFKKDVESLGFTY